MAVIDACFGSSLVKVKTVEMANAESSLVEVETLEMANAAFGA